MLKKTRISLTVMAVLGLLTAQAQDGKLEMDPSGFVTKYDSEFHGIGPEVYVLPAPRTKEEELADSYKQKKDFYESISRHLDLQNLQENFRHSSNAGYLNQNFNPFPSTDADWNALIQKMEQNNNPALAGGLANEYAFEAIKAADLSKAIQVLERGRQLLASRNLLEEQAVLEFNLATVYQYQGDQQEAIALQERYLRRVSSAKQLQEQAQTLLSIAMTEAYSKNYRAAENSIIRQAVPLFNKIKDSSGKVQAWTKLAKIYQMQNKHTEAQWFLIQARDLAKARNIKQDLPEIEYMLGYSKYVQQNYRVARAELENARSMADAEQNKLLALAINDKLGDIYLLMGEYKEAEQALDQYWQLRREIFPHETSNRM